MDLKALFEQLLAIAKADELKVILPALANFFNSVSGNPTAANWVVQFTALQAAVIAAQPGIQQAMLQQIAQAVNQAAAALLTPKPAA